MSETEEYLREAVMAHRKIDKLKKVLEWVVGNYRATLSGKSVRDADECLEAADILLKEKT